MTGAIVSLAVASVAAATEASVEPGADLVPATDAARVERSGHWIEKRHRQALWPALASEEDGAALEFHFRGSGVALVMDTLTVPSYGKPERGLVEVFVDRRSPTTVVPHADGNEIVVARRLGGGEHRIRVVHRRGSDGAGVRLIGFRVLAAASGDLDFSILGEVAGFLIDVRAVVTHGGRVVRDALVRNWLTGTCRIAGLPAAGGYLVELRASGWRTASRRFSVHAGQVTALDPVYLVRDRDLDPNDVKFPGPGRAAVVRPGDAFRTRIEAHDRKVAEVHLRRAVGPAVVSRVCRYADDPAAAYYYYSEGTVSVPAGTPPGLYDMHVRLGQQGQQGQQRAPVTLVAPRSVHVVREFPRDPAFVGVGHLDTWGQAQAEYLERVVTLANLLAPDMVLVANEVNAAYVAGALDRLEMPVAVTFGNHKVFGHERWFGDPVHFMNYGPGLAILNFGREWAGGSLDADALLAGPARSVLRIINAFEPNAPIALLDRRQVSLIHDGHGPGPRTMRMGATPTLRVGKVDSESFRVVRFRQGVLAGSAPGDADPPAIPFPRHGAPPVGVAFDEPNDGTRTRNAARWTNRQPHAFPGARIVFVMPGGRYRATGGRVEDTVESDDGRHTLVTARADLAPQSSGVVEIGP